MKRIQKNNEPVSLTNYKAANPTLRYSDLNDGNEIVRIDIRQSCLNEQYFLCAYCCNRITITDSHNEHIISQNSLPGNLLTLDYNNIVASCQSKFNCGHYKGENTIDLTPLMDECESEIIYQLNGKMTHSTPRAYIAINTLNLRNKALERKRKDIIDIVLFKYVEDLNDLSLEEDYYLEMIIDEISQEDNEGKLEAFSPIVTNVIRQFIS